ncbi:MAG: type II and III secretion system protein family protein [Janthinobacterium lividum]
MKQLLGALTFVLLALGLQTAALAEAVDLEVGSSRTFTARGPITQVVIDVPDVVKTVAPGSRQLLVTGVKPGLAHVVLVAGKDRTEYAVRVSEAGAKDSLALIRRLTSQPGLEDVVVERRDGKLVLTGKVPDLAAQVRAIAIATSISGSEVTDLLEIAGNQMVAVDVRFVAVSDTTLKALGLNFSKLAGGFQWALVGPNSLVSSAFSPATGLDVSASAPLQNAFNLFLAGRGSGILGMLSALSDAGLSQVLAQPTLLARSGEKAEFLAGGEVPIPVPQAGGASGAITIEYRQYGVRLSVEPYVLSNKRIVLKLAPEVSELDTANRITIQGFSIPAFRRRSANTTVELGDGESFVIAGLTYSNSSTNESKVPLLGDIPILGTLFRRTERSLEKLELIIVATPRLVTPLKDEELKRMLPTSIAPPTLGDTLMNKNSTERRAASFGLSR